MLLTSLSEWLEPKTLPASRKSTCEVNFWYNSYFLRHFVWLSCFLGGLWNSLPGDTAIVDFVLDSRPREAVTSVINGLITLTQGHVLSKIEEAVALTAGQNTRFGVSRVLALAQITSVIPDKSPEPAASHCLHLSSLQHNDSTSVTGFCEIQMIWCILKFQCICKPLNFA